MSKTAATLVPPIVHGPASVARDISKKHKKAVKKARRQEEPIITTLLRDQKKKEEAKKPKSWQVLQNVALTSKIKVTKPKAKQIVKLLKGYAGKKLRPKEVVNLHSTLRSMGVIREVSINTGALVDTKNKLHQAIDFRFMPDFHPVLESMNLEYPGRWVM
jgi:hypothetical protein